MTRSRTWRDRPRAGHAAARRARRPRPPTNLDELLEQTRNARAVEAKANAAREKEFLAKREQQAALLAEAKRARDAAEARSKQLSATFDANETKLAELEELMTQRLGTLGELFGVVRQVAGDGSSVLYNSLISAQFPKRDEFFAGLGKAKSLPSIDGARAALVRDPARDDRERPGGALRDHDRGRGRHPEAGGGRPHRRLRRRLGRPLSQLPAERRHAGRALAPASRRSGPPRERAPGGRAAATSRRRSIRRAACCSR